MWRPRLKASAITTAAQTFQDLITLKIAKKTNLDGLVLKSDRDATTEWRVQLETQNEEKFGGASPIEFQWKDNEAKMETEIKVQGRTTDGVSTRLSAALSFREWEQ